MKKLILTDDDYNALIDNIHFMREINRRWAQNDTLTTAQREHAADRYMTLGKLYNLLTSQE